jgi:hypothetical protein
LDATTWPPPMSKGVAGVPSSTRVMGLFLFVTCAAACVRARIWVCVALVCVLLCLMEGLHRESTSPRMRVLACVGVRGRSARCACVGGSPGTPW